MRTHKLPYTTLSDTVLWHNLSSTIAFLFPASPIPCSNLPCPYWRKLTCGVIRSFNLALFLTSHLEIYIYIHMIVNVYIYIYMAYIFSDSLFWHSIWHSLLTFYSGILSGIYSDILSGILSGPYSDILSGIFFWHSFWHCIWRSFLVYSIWHLFWHSL